MKNFILLSTVFFCFFSCDSTTILDKEFSFEYYENLDYKKLIQSKLLTDEELFLLNYAIIRQRDYFNYEVEGKTYGEILEMAKTFKSNGLPVEVNMNDNGKQDRIIQTVFTEDIGFVRKGQTKRIVKTLNFKCKYEYRGEKEIVLLNSSFIVRGPFGDYITTVNYEINCILEKDGSVEIGFVVPGKIIKKNLMYEGNPRIQRLGIDDILSNLSVESSGMSLKDEGRYFKDCFFNAARIEPHVVLDFGEKFKDQKWKTLGTDGKTYQLDLGDMHTPDTNDEVIQMR